MTRRGIIACVLAVKSFLAEKRASVTVDFVISIPILLSVLVVTSEYGRILQVRTALENAVADATRYLARAPYDTANNRFAPEVIDRATGLIRARINSENISIAGPTYNGGDFATVSLQATVGVDTPALRLLALGFQNDQPAPEVDGVRVDEIEGFRITSTDTARHFGL